jgi:hypothetical protein
MRKTLTIQVIINRQGEHKVVASGDLTENEHGTLISRIATYVKSCNKRRKKEAADRRAAEQLGKKVCIACNDTGEVRKRVWNANVKKWVYAPGMMPCPQCSIQGERPSERAMRLSAEEK